MHFSTANDNHLLPIFSSTVSLKLLFSTSINKLSILLLINHLRLLFLSYKKYLAVYLYNILLYSNSFPWYNWPKLNSLLLPFSTFHISLPLYSSVISCQYLFIPSNFPYMVSAYPIYPLPSSLHFYFYFDIIIFLLIWWILS